MFKAYSAKYDGSIVVLTATNDSTYRAFIEEFDINNLHLVTANFILERGFDINYFTTCCLTLFCAIVNT